METINLPSSLVEMSLPNTSFPLLEVHLISRGDIFYKKGRVLAETVYRQVWQTAKLIDENDYGVVISSQGSVVGNVNFQLRREGMLLKSEHFFCQEHWHSYYKGDGATVAEVSALALEQNLSPQLRRPTLMLLILGLQTICRLEGIKFLVTVQHEYLIRILVKSLHLPFFVNQQIQAPQTNVPNDDYWKQAKPPQIYYLEPHSIPVVDTCSSFLSYLNLAGVQTAFRSRLKVADLSYTAFRQSWNQEKNLTALCVSN